MNQETIIRGWVTEAFGGTLRYLHSEKDESRHDQQPAILIILARARVTAQELGLKAVEPEPLKVGDWVRITEDPGNGSPYRWLDIVRVGSVDGEWAIIASDGPLPGSRSILRRKLEKLSKEEIAAQEQARVPKFGDRVEYQDDCGWKVASDVDTPWGNWALTKEWHGPSVPSSASLSPTPDPMSKNEPPKIAEGKWSTRRKFEIYAGGYFVAATGGGMRGGNAMDADHATLIADAGNAYQATGLLPSEMAEQLAELMKFNKRLLAYWDEGNFSRHPFQDELRELLTTPNTNDHG